jgi:hypothetical protein
MQFKKDWLGLADHVALDTIGALAQNLATFRFVPAAFSNYIAKKLGTRLSASSDRGFGVCNSRKTG